MRLLLQHPLFWLGLFLRLALVLGLAPYALTEWYAPFLQHSVQAGTLDPWAAWLEQGGNSKAFPYGYAMWLIFLPAATLVSAVGLPAAWGYSATLLAADFGLLLTLRQLLPARPRLLLLVYWLSPIVILATYALGFNDIIPTLFLTLALFAIKNLSFRRAGFSIAAAISAKLSMVVPLPFILVYLFNNKALRGYFPRFGQGMLLGLALLGVPFVASRAGVQMLAGNPEIGKVFHLAVGLSENISVYLVPLLYLVILYSAWRVRRLDYSLFCAITGVALLALVLLTPASPGWFVWCLPFLVLFQAHSDRTGMALFTAFSGLYALSTLLVTPMVTIHGHPLELQAWLQAATMQGSRASSLLHTAMIAVGLIVALRVWREAISRSDFFKLSRRPFILGLAGDSGAGKDTLADALVGLWGQHSVTRLSGDDYHLWDRHKPLWQVMTHLNPNANNLEGFARDVIALSKGNPIHVRHYDHGTGKSGKPLRLDSNDFIVVSGLHALYLPVLRERYDLSIYLDIDEGLRRHLKIKRDVQERGHDLARVHTSLAAREDDSQKFIRPQAAQADLVFALKPIHARVLDATPDAPAPKLKLLVKTRLGFNELALTRVLVGVCGLHVDMTPETDGKAAEMTIEGEISADDIAVAAKMLCEQAFEFLDTVPQWQDGMLGVMQLVTVSHFQQALSRRAIT